MPGRTLGNCNCPMERCWGPGPADCWIILKVELIFAAGFAVGYKREGGVKDGARVSGLSYQKNGIATN